MKSSRPRRRPDCDVKVPVMSPSQLRSWPILPPDMRARTCPLALTLILVQCVIPRKTSIYSKTTYRPHHHGSDHLLATILLVHGLRPPLAQALPDHPPLLHPSTHIDRTLLRFRNIPLHLPLRTSMAETTRLIALHRPKWTCLSWTPAYVYTPLKSGTVPPTARSPVPRDVARSLLHQHHESPLLLVHPRHRPLTTSRTHLSGTARHRLPMRKLATTSSTSPRSSCRHAVNSKYVYALKIHGPESKRRINGRWKLGKLHVLRSIYRTA